MRSFSRLHALRLTFRLKESRKSPLTRLRNFLKTRSINKRFTQLDQNPGDRSRNILNIQSKVRVKIAPYGAREKPSAYAITRFRSRIRRPTARRQRAGILLFRQIPEFRGTPRRTRSESTACDSLDRKRPKPSLARIRSSGTLRRRRF